MSTNNAFQANLSSLSAGNQETSVYYSNSDPPRPSPHTAPSITPYLGLRARLSQVWINRWTVLLLLILVRCLIAVASLNSNLASARREALSACSSVEDIGSSMASMPHYMAQGVNELTALGATKAVNGLMDMTTLSVTGVEELVVFVIDLMTSTYVCLITLAVGGALHTAIEVVEDAQDFLNSTIGDITDDIKTSVSTFETAWNEFLEEIDSGLSTITGSQVTAPTLDLNSSMEALSTLTLPANELNEGLDTLNKSIPTFSQVNNFTKNAIRLPFEEIKKLINESMGNYTFDKSVFPVPQKETLTFCSGDDGIADFFDGLADLTQLAKNIFIGVLLAAALIVCIPMAWIEIRRWRKMQQRSQLVRSTAHDPMDVVYIVSRPYTATAGIKAASRFQASRRQILTRWVVAYATSTPALFLLALALAGLFSCACQLALLRSLEKEVPQLTNEVSAFADKVVSSLNNASEQWAVGTNKIIDSANTRINDDLFGWVNISTTALNDTLNTFVDDMTDVLNTTFGGTILYEPITDVLDCLITLKIEGIQKGLTWVKDNAHVDFPTLPNNTFSIGANDSLLSASSTANSFLADPGQSASDSISSAILRVANELEDGIKTEALISTAVLCVWFFVVIIGITRALTLWFKRDRLRGEGGTDDAHVINNSDPNGFHDIPLTTIHEPDMRGPAPKYQPSVSVNEYFTKDNPFSHEDDYQDQKLGFAGQRDYESSLRVGDSKPGHIRQSSYGEVLSESDIKR